MPRKKQEDKKRRYTDKAEKERNHKVNEEEIYKCFSLKSGYWGIDRIVLEVDVETVIDAKLHSKIGTLCTVVANPLRPKQAITVFEKYSKIEIYDPQFGRLKVVIGDPNPYTKYERLELFQSGINVKSGCMDDIWERYNLACAVLENKYGITLGVSPSIHLLELCFTFASDNIIPLPVRKYVCGSFAGSTTVDARAYSATSSTKTDKGIVSSGRCDTKKDVFYDKTAKCEHLNQISKKSKHKIRVYRMEFLIPKSRLIKDEQLCSKLLSELTDNKIVAYLKMRVEKAILYYVTKMVPVSLEAVSTLLKKARKMHEFRYQSIFDGFISLEKDKNDFSKIIDDESIIFADLLQVFSASNVSTRRKSLLFSTSSSKSPRKKMYGYDVERIIALMLTCLKDGLGCKPSNNTSAPKHFVVGDGNYPESDKNTYLYALIRHRKKNKRIIYAELIVDRILNQWDPHNLKMPTLQSLDDLKKMRNNYILIWNNFTTKYPESH